MRLGLRTSRGWASGPTDTPPPGSRSLPISNCVQSGTRWKSIPRLADCAYRGQTSSGVLASNLLQVRPESWGVARMIEGLAVWRAARFGDFDSVRPCANGNQNAAHSVSNWRKSRPQQSEESKATTIARRRS
ncbi:MAG: hypothetical protein IT425_09910 [Pirellulales bacterium]|nr:hypothetical protein [Pirellulales bacterium]